MKYYLIAGEASGDLHASHLMRALRRRDADAEFRFFGGDMMSAVGGERVRHYRDLAYMGFVPVLTHLPTIMRNMARCKEDIVAYDPDVVILVDYPGFNLSIAGFLRKKGKALGLKAKTYYYISPKVWAWKEHRVKNIKRDIDRLFSILPFEVPFFEEKHGYKIDYVGNPTAQEVREFKKEYKESRTDFCLRHGLDPEKKILAILPGSRRQEIKDNLRKMRAASLSVVQSLGGVQSAECRVQSASAQPNSALCTLHSALNTIITDAPGIEPSFYDEFLDKDSVLLHGETYKLLAHADAALVVSGTASLETALFRVPQVVVYDTPLHPLYGLGRRLFLKVKWVSLVNLIANREVVPECVADTCTTELIAGKLRPLLADTPERSRQLDGYNEVWEKLGDKNAPEEAARLICESLKPN